MGAKRATLRNVGGHRAIPSTSPKGYHAASREASSPRHHPDPGQAPPLTRRGRATPGRRDGAVAPRWKEETCPPPHHAARSIAAILKPNCSYGPDLRIHCGIHLAHARTPPRSRRSGPISPIFLNIAAYGPTCMMTSSSTSTVSSMGQP